VHCNKGIGGPAHTNETVFAPVLSANKVHGEVALCVPNSWPRTSTERRHWELIAVVAVALSTLQPVHSCISQVYWLPMHVSVLSQHHAAVKTAHCVSAGALQSTL